MSTGVVVKLPTSAAAPVDNPRMRPGPKPKGTASFYAARLKRRSAELRRRDQEDIPDGMREVVALQAKALAVAMSELGTGERWQVIAFAESLAGKR